MRSGPQFSAPPLTPVVKRLIMLLGGAFVLELVLTNFLRLPVVQLLALWPSAPGFHTLWQVVTYALVEPPHAVTSVIIGLLFLWLIMSPFELQFGPRHTIRLSLLATVAAGLAALLLGTIVSASPPLFGSTPIAYAGMAAMARSIGRGRLSLFGMFQMTPNQLLALLVGLSVVMYLASLDHTQLVASLAALATGIAYVEWMRSGRLFPRSAKPKRANLHVVRGGRDDDPPKWLN